MNDELNRKWAEAGRTGKFIPVGDIVVCDICDEDFTTRRDVGGFLFGSYAYCPGCALDGHRAIKGYGEEHLIIARCGETEAFADFVRRMRGPDAGIQIGPL